MPGSGVPVPLGLADQRELKLGQPGGDDPDMVAQVEPQVGGDLVVAAAAGPQLAAELADPLEQAALERGVHVLVLGRRAERAVRQARPRSSSAASIRVSSVSVSSPALCSTRACAADASRS